MRLNIFLLLYFFAAVAIFTFGYADRTQPRHCRHNLANAGPDNLVQPEDNENDEEWSRFIDGEYFVAGRGPVVIWVNIISKDVITMKYEILRQSKNELFFEPFGIKECRQHLELKTSRIAGLEKGSRQLNLAECGCKGYVKDDELYIPMKLWADVDAIKISFEQRDDRRGRIQTLGIYLSEEEAEKWKTLPMCLNKKYLLEEEEKYDEDELNPLKMEYVKKARSESFNGKKPFYVINGIEYADLYKRDTVLWLEIKADRDWSARLYVLIQLQRDKTLHQDVEIKIEVNGEAPHKNFELLEDGKGLKIFLQHHHCLQTYGYIGLMRYVIRVSEPDLLRINFFEYDGNNWPAIFSEETLAIYHDYVSEARSNNNFTTYLLKYIPPTTTISPNEPPAPEPVTNLPPSFLPTPLPATSTPENYHIQPSSAPNIQTSASTSKQHREPTPSPATPATSDPEIHPIQPSLSPSSNIKTSTSNVPVADGRMLDLDDCNGSLTTYLLLLIITIIIDVILAIILVLLIIFAYRGSKKMKAAMARKKMKDSKAAIGGSIKQGAAAATSPMATTPSKTETKGKKKIEKSAENEMKGKTTGGKKSTDEKTTTYYTADQTKYHTVDQTHYYTVDTTFDKSKKGKK